MKKIVTAILLVFTLLCVVKTPKVNALAVDGSLEELRGVWVSTVSNIDIGKQLGNDDDAIKDYKNKLTKILNKAENFGLNAIFFQVRPSNDAFYESDYNPWSTYFYRHGVNPGWDMLTWLIDECHARGIELHAWLNPYRVTASSVASLSDSQEKIDQAKFELRAQAQSLYPEINNPLNILDDEEFLSTIVLGAEGKLVLNPAKQATIDHVTNTIKELIENYDVDGIHFDDYFYPSGGIEVKYDSQDYNEYKENGGNLAVADWRRENVNKMVKSVSDVVAEHNENNPDQYTAFGISPAPVWAPSIENCPDGRGQEGGMNVVCGSYSSYNNLYADTKKWVEEEWLDYILPQAYASLDGTYKELVTWWARICAPTDVKLFVGTGYYKLAENSDDPFDSASEVQNQIMFVQEHAQAKVQVDGFVLFSYRNLETDTGNLGSANSMLRGIWNKGALLPSYEEVKPITELPEYEIMQLGNKYYISFNEVENANGYVLYAIPKGQEVDFDAEGVIVQKVFNELGNGKPQKYNALTELGTTNYDFVLRIYDNANNPIDEYVKFDFSKTVVNKGPQIEVLEFDSSKEYTVGEKVKVQVSVTSDLDLPLTVQLKVRHNGMSYSTTLNMTQVSEGVYECEYTTVLEAEVQFKVCVNDTDRDVELELDPFTVKKATTSTPEPNPDKEPSTSKSDCKIGFASILPIAAAGALLLLRKKK